MKQSAFCSLKGHSKQVGSRRAHLLSFPTASLCLPVQACYRRRGGPAQIFKVCPKEEEHPASCRGTAPLSTAIRNPSTVSLQPGLLGAGLGRSDYKTYRIVSSDTTLRPHNASIHLPLTSSISLSPFLCDR